MASSRASGTVPVVWADRPAGVPYENPVPHVLMLTAIVVGISTAALGLGIVVRIKEEYGTIEEHEITDRLGPDLCSPAGPPDVDEIARLLTADASQPLTGALLDQRSVAGFGNIYVNEQMWELATRAYGRAMELDPNEVQIQGVLVGLLPPAQAAAFSRIEPYGFLIVIALLYFDVLDRFLFYPIAVILRFLGIG